MRNIIKILGTVIVGILILAGCSSVEKSLPEGLPDNIPYVSDSYLIGSYSHSRHTANSYTYVWFIDIVSDTELNIEDIDTQFADAGFKKRSKSTTTQLDYTDGKGEYFIGIQVRYAGEGGNGGYPYIYSYTILKTEDGATE